MGVSCVQKNRCPRFKIKCDSHHKGILEALGINMNAHEYDYKHTRMCKNWYTLIKGCSIEKLIGYANIWEAHLHIKINDIFNFFAHLVIGNK